MPEELSNAQEERTWDNYETYYASVREPIRDALRQTMRETTENLRGERSADEIPDADNVAYLLERAAACGLAADPNFGEFARSAVETIIRHGVSSSSGRTIELARTIESAAAAVGDSGKPTSALHLARAVFLRTMGSTARLDALHAAIRTARSYDDKFAANLELAQLYVDTSQYPSAKRVLDCCDELVGSTQLSEVGSVEILQMRGLIYYYSGHYRRANKTFEAVRRLHEDVPKSSRLDRIAGEAHHYLGRMEAMRGNYDAAVQFIVTANRLSHGSGRQQRRSVAYFHIRLAELLLAAGSNEETYHHLAEAERALRLAHETGSAESEFGSVLARFHMRTGDISKAEQALLAAVKTARQDGHIRGRLLSGAHLMRLYATTRRYRSALRTLNEILRSSQNTTESSLGRSSSVQLAHSWLRHRLDSVSSYIGLARTGLLMGLYGLRRRFHLRRAPIHCPCGAVHVPPVY